MSENITLSVADYEALKQQIANDVARELAQRKNEYMSGDNPIWYGRYAEARSKHFDYDKGTFSKFSDCFRSWPMQEGIHKAALALLKMSRINEMSIADADFMGEVFDELCEVLLKYAHIRYAGDPRVRKTTA